jgi:AcrR family transcriptional regulator
VTGGGRDGSAARQRRPARRRTGRRAGDSGTRDAIIDAARDQFAERGYDRATIRGIAAAAGVDPALVHHFYGTKERLFTAAMQLPVVPSEAIGAALASGPQRGESLGEHLVRSAVVTWDIAEVNAAFQGLLRSALTSDRAAAMLREFVTETILVQVAGAADGHDDQDIALRASLVASHMIGLALTRYVLRFGPMAAAQPDELAAAVGPAIDRYLTGRLERG